MSGSFGGGVKKGKSAADPFTLSRVNNMVAEDITIFDINNRLESDHPVLARDVAVTLVVVPELEDGDMSALDEFDGDYHPTGLAVEHEWGSAVVTLVIGVLDPESGDIVGEPFAKLATTVDRVTEWAEWLLRAMKVRGTSSFDKAVES